MARCQYITPLIKGPGTCFQSPALSQTNVRNVCLTVHQYLTKDSQDSKEISLIVTYNRVTVVEICGFHKNIKIQVSQEENNFPLNKKIHLSKAHNFITARSLNEFHYTQQKYQKSVLTNSNLDTKILTEGNVNVTKIFLFFNNQ